MENLFIRLLIRGALSLGAFNCGLLLAKNAIESSGMGGPRNPAWRLAHGLLTTEIAIASWIVRIFIYSTSFVLVIFTIVMLLHHFVFNPKARRIAAVKKREEEARAAIEDLERQMLWKKQDEENKAWEIRRQIESHEKWKKRQAEKEARLKARSTEQVKADAIEEVTKGW